MLIFRFSSTQILIPLHGLEWEGITVHGSLFQPFHSSSGLYQGVLLCVRVGSQEKDLAALLSERLSCHNRIGLSPPGTSQESPPALQGPGGCHLYGEIRPQANQQGLVFQNVDRRNQRECLTGGLSDYQILECGRHVPSSGISACLRFCGSKFSPHGMVCSQGQGQDAFSPIGAEVTPDSLSRLPTSTSPFFIGMLVVHQEERWASGDPLQVPPPSPSFHKCITD